MVAGGGLLLIQRPGMKGGAPLATFVDEHVRPVMGWTPPDGIDVPKWWC
jgi:hypothetical protein